MGNDLDQGWTPRRAGAAAPPQWHEVGTIPPGPPGDSWENLPYSMSGDLYTRAGTTPYPVAGGDFEIVSVTARVGGAPIGAPAVLDVNLNGESIYDDPADQPRIMPGTRAAVVGQHDVLSVTEGDYFTVDVDTPGIVPASDLTLVIRLRKIP